jgi:hypothetical protein
VFLRFSLVRLWLGKRLKTLAGKREKRKPFSGKQRYKNNSTKSTIEGEKSADDFDLDFDSSKHITGTCVDLKPTF